MRNSELGNEVRRTKKKEEKTRLDSLWAEYMAAEREAASANIGNRDEAETRCAIAYRAWWEVKRTQEHGQDAESGVKRARSKGKLFGKI